MKTLFISTIITLVFNLSLFAATEDRSTIKVDTQNPTHFPNQDAIDNLSISEVPKVKKVKTKKPYIFSHRKSLFFYSGIYYSTEEREYESPLGFYYDKYLENLDAYTMGFNIVDGLGRIQLGKKHLNNLGRLRYHLGWQIGITVDADKGLANLVNFKKFFIGGLAGLEYSTGKHESFRLDGVVFQGTSETEIQANLGYVYSW